MVKCSDSEAREKLKKLCFDAKDNIVGEVSEEAAEGAVRYVGALTLKRELRNGPSRSWSQREKLCRLLYRTLGWDVATIKQMEARLLGLFADDEQLSEDRCAQHGIIEASFKKGTKASSHFAGEEIASLSRRGAVEELSSEIGRASCRERV